jgi:hypothetical protein
MRVFSNPELKAKYDAAREKVYTDKIPISTAAKMFGIPITSLWHYVKEINWSYTRINKDKKKSKKSKKRKFYKIPASVLESYGPPTSTITGACNSAKTEWDVQKAMSRAHEFKVYFYTLITAGIKWYLGVISLLKP